MAIVVGILQGLAFLSMVLLPAFVATRALDTVDRAKWSQRPQRMGLSWGARGRALKQSGLGYDMEAPAMCVPARFVFVRRVLRPRAIKLGLQAGTEPCSQGFFWHLTCGCGLHCMDRI